jgi:hypothetical protein
MNRQTKSDAVWSIDDLELELRQLPGVHAAGFDESPDVLLVQLHVADDAGRAERSDQPVPVSASRIAARHSDRPVAVEVVRWRSAPAAATVAAPVEIAEPIVVAAVDETAEVIVAAVGETAEVIVVEASRPRLLAVLAFPDTDELEVHLVLDGRRTIGRAAARRGIDAAVEATIDAVHELGLQSGLAPRPRWVRALEDAGYGDEVVVAVALEGVDDRRSVQYGMAPGASLIDAAARATLDALNRRLGRED